MKTTKVIFEDTALGHIETDVNYNDPVELYSNIKYMLGKYRGNLAIILSPFNCSITL